MAVETVHQPGRAARSLPSGLGRDTRIVTRSLELNVTTHCNLKCYGCGRGSPAFGQEFVSREELALDLGKLAPILRVQEFKLAGGEPLQHPEILEILDVVRSSGVADSITLITNGVLLEAAGADIWSRIDHIWVSVYPGVERGLSEDQIMDLGRRHGVSVRYKVTDSFDRRMLNAENLDKPLVQEIYSSCYQTRGCHSLYTGRYFKCASGPLIPKWLETVGCTTGFTFADDGVSVRGNPALERDLEAYLSSERPLDACHYCLGGMGKSSPHHQLNLDGVRDWLSEDHTDTAALIDLDRLERDKNRRNSSIVSRIASGLLGPLKPRRRGPPDGSAAGS
jgi:organic radical activating enzyme